MKHACFALATIVAVSFAIQACSGPKEEIRNIEPEIARPKMETPPPPRVFKYEDRYFVRGAAIGDPTNVDDPVQAMRVIQVKEGAHAVLVITSFDKTNEDGKDVALETWLGVEMPSFAPGTYDLAKATKVSFYRFYLGQSGVRFDGTSFSGTITIESAIDGFIVGSIDAMISGVTKSFDHPSKDFQSRFSGSFRIADVPLEATIMKGRK
jgi:hypothetical protein